MAIEKKHGKLDIPGIPDDEPVFVIRAQDAYVLDTLRDYFDRRESGATREDKRKLRDHMNAVFDAFEDWSIRKTPTL